MNRRQILKLAAATAMPTGALGSLATSTQAQPPLPADLTVIGAVIANDYSGDGSVSFTFRDTGGSVPMMIAGDASSIASFNAGSDDTDMLTFIDPTDCTGIEVMRQIVRLLAAQTQSTEL